MAKSGSRPTKKPSLPPIPVLTEIVEDDPSGIPTLRDVDGVQPSPMTDAECLLLAAQIAPRLETLLRARLNRQIDDLMRDIMHEVHTSLPAMVRAAVSDRIPSPSTPGSEQPQPNNNGTRKKL